METKLPPQALDIEAAILSALLTSEDSLDIALPIIKPEVFYSENNKVIYSAILKLSADGKPIDYLTICEKLKTSGVLESIGGSAYITSLLKSECSQYNIETYCRILVEKHIKRETIRESHETIKNGFDESYDAFDLVYGAANNIDKIIQSATQSKGVEKIDTLTDRAISEYYKRVEASKTSTVLGIPTGLKGLDKITGGWQDSDLIIIAARPGVGKTAAALFFSLNAAKAGYGGLYASLEMSAIQLDGRLILMQSGISANGFKYGSLFEDDEIKMNQAASLIKTLKIEIDDAPQQTLVHIRSKARRLKRENKLNWIVIDYLQLMGSTEHKKGGNREQEISSFSSGLKAIAKELDVPVIALSQLNRSVETRGGDKRPQLSDLRESGAIEQDADMVMFVYRAAYHGIERDEDGNSTDGLGEFIIAKHRGGAIGDIQFKHNKSLSQFFDMENEHNFEPMQLQPNTQFQNDF